MGDNFEKLKMLERGASKAPWRTHLIDDTSIIDANTNPVASTFPDGGVDDDVDFHAPVEQMERDAAFIVAARNQIPRLIAEIERLREALHEARPHVKRSLDDYLFLGATSAMIEDARATLNAIDAALEGE